MPVERALLDLISEPDEALAAGDHPRPSGVGECDGSDVEESIHQWSPWASWYWSQHGELAVYVLSESYDFSVLIPKGAEIGLR